MRNIRRKNLGDVQELTRGGRHVSADEGRNRMKSEDGSGLVHWARVAGKEGGSLKVSTGFGSEIRDTDLLVLGSGKIEIHHGGMWVCSLLADSTCNR